MNSVRGTKDWLPSDVELYNYILDVIKKHVNLRGFSEIFVPILEDVSLFKRAVGENTDIVAKEMYAAMNFNKVKSAFERISRNDSRNDSGSDSGSDSGDACRTANESTNESTANGDFTRNANRNVDIDIDDMIVLRPEATSSIVRFLSSNNLLQSMPQRLYTHGPMFRYERPQKGRLRQLHQFSIECFGLQSPDVDADVIKCAFDILDELGLINLGAVLEINSLGSEEDRLKYKNALVNYLSKYEKDLSSDSKRRMHTNPLRILDSKDKSDIKICENAPKMKDYLSKESEKFFDDLMYFLNKNNVKFVQNDSLVRGLDYYTHTVFEFKLDAFGAQSTLMGGGRYDGLVDKMFGKNIPAIGWGMGLDRVCMVMKENELHNVKNNEQKIGILLWNGGSENLNICAVNENDRGEKCSGSEDENDGTGCTDEAEKDREYKAFGMKVVEDYRKKGINTIMIFEKKIQKCFEKAEKSGCSHVAVIGENEMQSGEVELKGLK